MTDAPPSPERYCLKCGYPLDHLDQLRCPECGRAFDSADSTTYSPTPARIHRWPMLLAWSTVTCPVLLLISFYGTYGWTWFYLGHQPRPYIDDVAYPPFGDLAVLLGMTGYVFGFLPSLLCLLVVDGYYLYRQRPRFVVASSVVLAIWAFPFLMFLLDPFGAWDWFMD